ncbi:uncharacterized protein LOC127257420 [Andrographis paniculata]|uniref:uncharacterized protein LOC127257420 n=1 Tax=Andrographis paniculata TaxID=175694 RepID=UPI0021E7B86B|nr:uncharacterized protein LOC127257420 [Andrographis paniculata]
MKKSYSGLLFLFIFMWAAAAVVMYIGYSTTTSFPGKNFTEHIIGETFGIKSRKLMDNRRKNETTFEHIVLEDYRPIDPVPSSKASIRPKPIQHGAPLMPYIPKPSPPPGKPNH